MKHKNVKINKEVIVQDRILKIGLEDFKRGCKKMGWKKPTDGFKLLIEIVNDSNNNGRANEANTQEKTKKLSLLWNLHQKGQGKLNSKRILDSDNQWKHLVRIKNKIIEYIEPDNSMGKYTAVTMNVFKEAELLSIKYGKKNLYLPFIVSFMETIFDNIDDSKKNRVTIRHQKIYKSYCNRRKQRTKKEFDPTLYPGSEEHMIIIKLSSILKDYDIGKKEFMKIQFQAFDFHKSIPRLKDLTSKAAIDRLEIGKLKSKPDADEPNTKEDKAYWKMVNKRNKK